MALAFEFSDAGVCTLFIDTRKTIFKSNGGNYDKQSSIFANFFNHHFNTKKLLKRKSVKGLAGHNREKFFTGAGIYSHANILERLRGFNLEFITETKNAIIYKLIYDEHFLNTDKKDELYL